MKFRLNKWIIVAIYKIMPGLEFANHVRNKLAGHIENDVIENSVQWEPTIFSAINKGSRQLQRLLMYKSILESGINSYVESKTGEHKIFNHKIDLLYPETSKKFYDYIEDLTQNAMAFINALISIIDDKIEYFAGLPANLIKNAGETDFAVKSKGR